MTAPQDDPEPNIERDSWQLSPAEWVARNERARMLAERAQLHDDADATAQLMDMVRPVIRTWVLSVPKHHRLDVLDALILKAYMMFTSGVISRSVDRPLGFVKKALRNEFIDQVRKILRRADSLPLDDDHPSVSAGWRQTDAEIRLILKRWRQESSENGTRIDGYAAQAIEIAYIFNVPIAEACRMLELTDRERAGVSSKISRDRRDPGSNLWRLARAMGWDEQHIERWTKSEGRD